MQTYLTADEKAHVERGMALDGERQFAVFMRKCVMDRATAIIAARQAGVKLL
jgi:hypothetical protein